MTEYLAEFWHHLTDFSWMTNSAAWMGLLTLVALEVVLGIDNIVFISILSGKLPEASRPEVRRKGLILAVIPRLLFLVLLGLILGMEKPLFSIWWPFEQHSHPGMDGTTAVLQQGKLGLTGKDLVLLIGGLFLLYQSVREIHHKLEGDGNAESAPGTGADISGDSDAALSPSGAPPASLSKLRRAVLMQIMFMNIIFSLDSIITAVGMVKEIPVMIMAVLISTVIMIVAVNAVSNFVDRHPTVKILALAFLLLIGTNLLAEAAHFAIPKGYVYFAMAFSVFVELLNIKTSGRRSAAVKLHPPA